MTSEAAGGSLVHCRRPAGTGVKGNCFLFIILREKFYLALVQNQTDSTDAATQLKGGIA